MNRDTISAECVGRMFCNSCAFEDCACECHEAEEGRGGGLTMGTPKGYKHKPYSCKQDHVKLRGLPFDQLIDKNGPTVKPELGPCWLWIGSLDRQGYGRFWIVSAHVVAHKKLFLDSGGVIPEGYELDHLCRVRRCVNPSHLEAVTHKENVVRGIAPQRTRETRAMIKHCRRGHEFTPENTLRKSNGGRLCRICKNESNKLFMRGYNQRERESKKAEQHV